MIGSLAETRSRLYAVKVGRALAREIGKMSGTQAQPVTIEVIGNHWLRCACYSCEVPGVVQEFCRQTGVQIQFIGYRAWDIPDSTAVPERTRLRLKAIREGRPDDGCFINRQWFSSGYHNGHCVVRAMQALYAAAGLDREPSVVREYGQAVGKRESTGCTIEHLRLADCAIGSMVAAESQVGKLFFGGGRTRSLAIGEHCQVDEFHYRGFDVNKLVEVARQQPEFSARRRSGRSTASSRRQWSPLSDHSQSFWTAGSLLRQAPMRHCG
jgi:hypothetical protein